MTESDGVKVFINQALENGVSATLQGGLAEAQLDNAIFNMQIAAKAEQDSIKFAELQKRYVEMMLEKTKLLLAGSVTLASVTNMPVMVALGYLEEAMRNLNDFIARTHIQVAELEKLITILEYARRDQELINAQNNIGMAAQQLDAYRTII